MMLFINDLGTMEFIIIIFIIILFFGPDKIPEFARNLGSAIRKLNELKENIKNEIIVNSKINTKYNKTEKNIQKKTNNIEDIKGTIKRL